MGNKNSKKCKEKKENECNVKQSSVYLPEPKQSSQAKASVDKKENDTVPRNEIDFLGHHIINIEQINYTKEALSNLNIPDSISQLIIEFAKQSYFASYCKISLSFKQKDDNLFYDFNFPNDKNIESNKMIKFNIYSYTMGTMQNLNRLNTFKRGSGYFNQYGSNMEYHATNFELHKYENNKIYLNKSSSPEQMQCVDVKFNIYMMSVKDDKYIFVDKSNFYAKGAQIYVLCIHYKYENSLKYAERYAIEHKNNYKLLFIVVIGTMTDKVYFEWNDVLNLSKRLNVSCFEVSTKDNDSTMFVYNQIVFEYIHWYKLQNIQ